MMYEVYPHQTLLECHARLPVGCGFKSQRAGGQEVACHVCGLQRLSEEPPNNRTHKHNFSGLSRDFLKMLFMCFPTFPKKMGARQHKHNALTTAHSLDNPNRLFLVLASLSLKDIPGTSSPFSSKASPRHAIGELRCTHPLRLHSSTHPNMALGSRAQLEEAHCSQWAQGHMENEPM